MHFQTWEIQTVGVEGSDGSLGRFGRFVWKFGRFVWKFGRFVWKFGRFVRLSSRHSSDDNEDGGVDKKRANGSEADDDPNLGPALRLLPAAPQPRQGQYAESDLVTSLSSEV
jgi:hypothetical protein